MKYQRTMIVTGSEIILNNKVYFEFDYLFGGSPEFIRFYLNLNDTWSDGTYKNDIISINRPEEEHLYNEELLRQIKKKCEYIMLRYDVI